MVLARKRERYRASQLKKGKLVKRYETHKPDPITDGAILPPVMDTRDLTGRLMGDPIPGRSALEQRASR